MRSTIFALALIASAGLVATPLAEGMRQNPEPEEQASTSVAGINVTVAADMWQGWPRDLTQVIPLLVTIENTSSSPIRVRYREFRLVPPGGMTRMALPPFQIQGTETVGTTGAVPGPYPFAIDRFWIAPHLAPYYPYLDPFAGPFAYDPWFYSTYYPAFREVPLPTAQMVGKALPEGVLEAGGKIQGFLYFEDGDPKGDMATFEMDVVSAATQQTLATARIPLEID